MITLTDEQGILLRKIDVAYSGICYCLMQDEDVTDDMEIFQDMVMAFKKVLPNNVQNAVTAHFSPEFSRVPAMSTKDNLLFLVTVAGYNVFIPSASGTPCRPAIAQFEQFITVAREQAPQWDKERNCWDNSKCFTH
jgi:hypothetical protein